MIHGDIVFPRTTEDYPERRQLPQGGVKLSRAASNYPGQRQMIQPAAIFPTPPSNYPGRWKIPQGNPRFSRAAEDYPRRRHLLQGVPRFPNAFRDSPRRRKVLQDRDSEGDMTDLTAQRAIVIGGSSGVGLATAKALCESGLECVVTGRDEAKLEAARQTLGPQGRAEQVDATSEEEVRVFFERAGSFDHLAASPSPERPIPRHRTRRDVTARPREPPQATGTAGRLFEGQGAHSLPSSERPRPPLRTCWFFSKLPRKQHSSNKSIFNRRDLCRSDAQSVLLRRC